MKREAVEKGALGFRIGLWIGKLLDAFGQSDKIRHRLRRFFVKQAADNVSLRSLKNGISSGRARQSPSSNEYALKTNLMIECGV
jgi:hypothetical protein